MFHAGASAAIIQDGEVIIAVAECARIASSTKLDSLSLAIKACRDAAGAKIKDVDYVATGRDSDATLSRKIQYALRTQNKILKFRTSDLTGHVEDRVCRRIPSRRAGWLCWSGTMSNSTFAAFLLVFYFFHHW